MNDVFRRMISVPPGQQIIREEAAEIARCIKYINHTSGSTSYKIDILKMRLMGLHMTVLAWMGERRAYSYGESDAYLPDFLASIGECAQDILSDMYNRTFTIRIVPTECTDEACLTWAS